MTGNAHIRNGLVGLALCGTLAAAPQAIAASDLSGSAGDGRDEITDRFDGASLDTNKWWLKQAHDGQYRISGRSVAITMDSTMRGCGAHCQRNEIRTAPKYRIRFGEDAVYSFRFRVDGAMSTGRWVSGQWKQQCDGSPFLAQRFNRDEFYITVQDRDCRVVVASSKPTGVRLPMTRMTDGRSQRVPPAADETSNCKTDIKVEYAADAVLPDPRKDWVSMSYRVRGGLNGKGLIEIHANGRFIARVTGSIGDDRVAGPNQYFKFGIYRSFTRGTSTVYMDDFSRRPVATAPAQMAGRAHSARTLR
jgi:hypothetical protein